MPIIQIVGAATGAYAFAHYVLGHEAPLLAATVTVSSLGFVRDARPRRVLETVIGMLVGIVIAEALLFFAGTGWWQLALALGATLAVARFLSPQASFAIAAGIQSLIVMIIPASAPFLRVADGATGAVCALLVTALIPRSALRPVTRHAEAFLAAMTAASRTTVEALQQGSRLRAERGLDKARALTAELDEWRAGIDSGVAIARISPFLRRQRSELQRQLRMVNNLDYAARNLRVVDRRAVYLCDDANPRPAAAGVLSDITRTMDVIAHSLHDISLEPAVRESLRAIAGGLDPRAVAGGNHLGDQNLIAAMRPLVVDLMAAAGRIRSVRAQRCLEYDPPALDRLLP